METNLVWKYLRMSMSSLCAENKTNKLEPRLEVHHFFGYPIGTKDDLLYDPKENVIVLTNAKFLEYDYMRDQKP